MPLKNAFLHAHLDFFPENNVYVSDEHGESFHREIKISYKDKRIRKCHPALWPIFVGLFVETRMKTTVENKDARNTFDASKLYWFSFE